MSPIPKVPETNVRLLQDDHTLASQRHSKRFNLNPLHYLTLPLKKNWVTVGPAFDKFHKYTSTASIILSAIALFTVLESRGWSLPRWPWAKDEKSNPPPSFSHANERYTVDDLVDEKLMEMLEEMKVYEGDETVPGKAVPEPDESENEVEKEAEEQFMEDAEEGVEDLVEEMELEGL